ncbi:hypothetical protein A4X03_0g9498, partial [Tilletia caries]
FDTIFNKLFGSPMSAGNEVLRTALRPRPPDSFTDTRGAGPYGPVGELWLNFCVHYRAQAIGFDLDHIEAISHALIPELAAELLHLDSGYSPEEAHHHISSAGAYGRLVFPVTPSRLRDVHEWIVAKEQVVELHERVTGLQQKLNWLHIHHGSLDRLTSCLHFARQENSALQAQIRKANEDRDGAILSLRMADEQLETQTTVLDNLRAEFDALDTKADRLEDELTACRRQLDGADQTEPSKPADTVQVAVQTDPVDTMQVAVQAESVDPVVQTDPINIDTVRFTDPIQAGVQIDLVDTADPVDAEQVAVRINPVDTAHEKIDPAVCNPTQVAAGPSLSGHPLPEAIPATTESGWLSLPSPTRKCRPAPLDGQREVNSLVFGMKTCLVKATDIFTWMRGPGRYTSYKLVGSGSQGSVFRARDYLQPEPVAIKSINGRTHQSFPRTVWNELGAL